jgi:DNA uptake protein ComE-like DNA-binding protein
MTTQIKKNVSNCRSRSGIVLLVTLVLLVVLAIVGYTLTCRLATQRHRSQYIIDYQTARYGCGSAVKYALATLEDIEPWLISRPNEPDFSDLFYLTEEEYDLLLAEWAAAGVLHRAQGMSDPNDVNDINNMSGMSNLDTIMRGYDANGLSDLNDMNNMAALADSNDPNSLVIRGPYGPAWPLVTEPLEFKIGTASVKIEIEDENAKYPICWMLLKDEKVQREIVAGFETFCEWMDVNEFEIESLEQQLDDVKQIKPFKLTFKEVTTRVPVRGGTSRRSKTTSRSRTRRKSIHRTRRVKVSAAKQFAEQSADLSKLLHSSLVDRDLLARPTILSDRRAESALKYTGTWGSGKVNINTAPRQVLEAAFSFGGDAAEIAEEIIQQRRTDPFDSIDDLKGKLLGRSESIRKCEDYITMNSTFFTIRVTAVSGVAEASAVIAITKQGKQVRKIAIITG